jgi:hypothetical protein
MSERRATPPRQPTRAAALLWYSAALALFLAIRAGTTLAAGANFDAPGDGWRSVWQLAVVGVLLIGIARPRYRSAAVVGVGVVYLLATVSELFDSVSLIGAIPVDMRDRIVHPLVACIALAGAWWAMRATGPDRHRADG